MTAAASKTSSMAIASPGRSFLGALGLVLLAIAALFAADTFLARTEQAETRIEAARLFEQGKCLMGRAENVKAIDRLKDALARDNRDYQRALAQAQLAAGKGDEAEATLPRRLRWIRTLRCHT
jgi:thioredoxin-like negative regulator of GroEL